MKTFRDMFGGNCTHHGPQDPSMPFSDGQLPTGMRSGDCAGRSHLLQKLCKRQFELAALVMINMPWGSKQLYPVNQEFAGDLV